jgi:dihydrofolate reductase
MPELRVHNFSISLDGYAAGPNQSLDDPFGVGGMDLPSWQFTTRSGRQAEGSSGGGEGVDDEMMTRGVEGIGATIMGRNMFGPVRGEWLDETWRGWWGDTPPYHHPVFVLTHHPRESFSMEGGTTFHFVTGIDAALEQALDAARGLDVRLGGGAATIRQCIAAGLLDDVHLVVVPKILGAGESLFACGGAGWDRYTCVERRLGVDVMHVRFRRDQSAAA